MWILEPFIHYLKNRRKKREILHNALKKFDWQSPDSLYHELYEAEKRSFKKFYEDAETLEEKIEVLSRYILPLNRETTFINLRLTRIEDQTKPREKLSIFLVFWAIFFSLYVTTSEQIWFDLLGLASIIFFLSVLVEHRQARKQENAGTAEIIDQIKESLLKQTANQSEREGIQKAAGELKKTFL